MDGYVDIRISAKGVEEVDLVSGSIQDADETRNLFNRISQEVIKIDKILKRGEGMKE